MLFRKSQTEPPPATPAPPETGKGRPTPKRRDAERRRGRTAPPKDKAEARKQMREERATAMAGLRAGDERYFPPRDRGPLRALARNWVDGRRNVSDFFWPVAIVGIVSLIVPVRGIQVIVMIGLFGFYALVGLDSALSLSGLSRALKKQWPDGASRKGALSYAFARGLQSRKRRLPPPAVDRGWTRRYRSGEVTA